MAFPEMEKEREKAFQHSSLLNQRKKRRDWLSQAQLPSLLLPLWPQEKSWGWWGKTAALLIASPDKEQLSTAEGWQDVAQAPQRGTARELQASLSSLHLPVQQPAVLYTTECAMHSLHTHRYAHKLCFR